MENKKFIIVTCPEKEFKSKYKRGNGIEVINYLDIMSKLESNDVFKAKPTKEIISIYIEKKIKRAIDSKKIETIFYLLDEFSPEKFNNIKSLVVSIDETINFDIR